MTPEDLIRIRHMLDAVKEIRVFTIGKCREDLDNNRMLTLGRNCPNFVNINEWMRQDEESSERTEHEKKFCFLADESFIDTMTPEVV